MSDPLSVAGTAVGIASLGIQVCQGLIKYLQAVNDRNEEIKDAVRDVKQVLSLLDNLNNTLPNVSLGNGSTSIQTCIANCNQKLTELQMFLDGLCKTQSGNRITKRAINATRTMSYPFQREKLIEMRQSLRSVLNDLNLILSVPRDSDASVHKTVNEISLDLKDHVKNHNDNSADLKDQIQSMQSTISDMLVGTKEQLHGTQLSIQDLDQQINGKLTIVETVTRSTETNSQVAVAMLEKLTQAVEFQSALMSTMVNGAPSVQDVGATTAYQRNYSTLLRNDITPTRSPNVRSWQGCYCAAALPKSRTSFQFWNLGFQFEEQEHHLRSCKLWGTRKGTKRRAKAELRMKLAWLSTRMIDACFEYASGTSRPGLSIRCRNIIRRIDSPVVTAIWKVENKLAQPNTPTQMILILKTMEHEILNLYSKGLASPLDTTEDGDTHAEILVSNVFLPIWYIYPFSILVPSSRIRQKVLQNEAVTFAFISLIRALLQANGCNPEELVKGISRAKPSALLKSMVQGAKAILSRSIEDLVFCVSRAPELVLEYVFSVDVVELAVNWPEGLKYILTTKASTFVSSGDEEYHCQLVSQAICYDQVESVHMLLEAGCCFPYQGRWTSRMSEEMASVVATHIFVRRLRLLKLAQTQLGLFLGNESVAFADSTAATICDALDAEHIQIPLCLRVESNYQSIYLCKAIPLHAFNQFWRKGFSHFDCIDFVGRTPMMIDDLGWNTLLHDGSFQHVKETISCLHRHGFLQKKANDPLDIGLNVFATGYHYMGVQFAYWSHGNFITHNDISDRLPLLTNLSCDTTTEDNCICWCNAEGHGCSPIKLFLKTLFLPAGQGVTFKDRRLHTFLYHQSFDAPGSGGHSILAKEVLRLLTFEAMDMTHTCCFFDLIGQHDRCNLLLQGIQDEWAIFCRDPDSIMEIRSCSNENRSAALLKDLMAEFIPQLQLLNSSHFAFEGFINTYWRRRISQLYSEDPMIVDDLHQHQAFQGFGVSSPSPTRVLPEVVHQFLGKDFYLLGPHDTISDEECISEVSRYMGMQCGGGVDCCESDQADSD
ncbi:unnamed protein product [Fusarium graminearum]|uniref:NACHT-NTPase and P-loop NTPases N-terminal domain-containing protein n=1 Tax=Gibberella zeae TaxID=5518 RepID=A0A9N8RL91_GIBZA|nr:unnamed protein product [Fusarium graminearum]